MSSESFEYTDNFGHRIEADYLDGVGVQVFVSEPSIVGARVITLTDEDWDRLVNFVSGRRAYHDATRPQQVHGMAVSTRQTLCGMTRHDLFGMWYPLVGVPQLVTCEDCLDTLSEMGHVT